MGTGTKVRVRRDGLNVMEAWALYILNIMANTMKVFKSKIDEHLKSIYNAWILFKKYLAQILLGYNGMIFIIIQTLVYHFLT